MIDYSTLMGVGQNQQRGNPQPSGAAFSSLGNMYGGGGASGTGSAPMNTMPGQPAQQPGMNLQGMLSWLGSAFQPQQGLITSSIPQGGAQQPSSGIGGSLQQLAQIYGAARGMPKPTAPQWAKDIGFGQTPSGMAGDLVNRQAPGAPIPRPRPPYNQA